MQSTTHNSQKHTEENVTYNKDIRTSVTNVVDDGGAGVVSYQYDDYGTTTRYGEHSFYNEICYTSGVYYELTSLYYLNARYYNPATGTFITQDSYRGEKNEYGTWNMYAYCGGNSINYVDPSGHSKVGLSNPPGNKTGYIPPKTGARKKNHKGKRGWVDKNGNVWVPDAQGHGGEHWDVEGKDGSYVNVYPDGHKRKGKGKVKLPTPKKVELHHKLKNNDNTTTTSNVNENLVNGVKIIVVGVVVYQAGKWITATILAPSTGGVSYIIAGATP